MIARIAQLFCRWRTDANTRRAEKARTRTVIWSERELHFACKHMLVGKPNTKDVSDPPFRLGPHGIRSQYPAEFWRKLSEGIEPREAGL